MILIASLPDAALRSREYRYAAAVREGADLWLTTWVRRAPKGDVNSLDCSQGRRAGLKSAALPHHAGVRDLISSHLPRDWRVKAEELWEAVAEGQLPAP